MAYTKEQKWELRYVSLKDGTIKNCYPQSEEKKNEQLAVCRKKGIKVIHCKKLYPFNTYANQHNFNLINDICYIAMHDMDCGETEYNESEYNKLAAIKEKAERFFCLPLPTAWLPWEEWKDAKELSEMAILHRQDACIRNGRPDLVTYC